MIRVLHVDDDPDVGELTVSHLERRDDRFDVVSETTASDGLERLTAEAFDCVVSDYQMPGTNGLEFFAAVREYEPDLPFIFFTRSDPKRSISFGEFERHGQQFFTGILRDITRRKQQTMELQRQNERLDEFAGIVAHDLRNPLNVVEGRINSRKRSMTASTSISLRTHSTERIR